VLVDLVLQDGLVPHTTQGDEQHRPTVQREWLLAPVEKRRSHPTLYQPIPSAVTLHEAFLEHSPLPALLGDRLTLHGTGNGAWLQNPASECVEEHSLADVPEDGVHR